MSGVLLSVLRTHLLFNTLLVGGWLIYLLSVYSAKQARKEGSIILFNFNVALLYRLAGTAVLFSILFLFTMTHCG